MRGLVIKSTGTSYGVYFLDGTTADCHIKGNFRIRGIRSTNPIAIGDYVEVKTENGNQDADKAGITHWITEVYDRKNYIIRRATNLSYASHILAANIDMAALIVTINHPKTSTTFIDRFLATCEAYRVPACIIFNKIDLLTEEEQSELELLRQLYESLNYTTYAISAKTNTALVRNQLAPLFHNKVTLLSGNSGVGKSTLLNAILDDDIARTGSISEAHHKGMHTTTFSEMYPINISRSDENAQQLGKENTLSWIIDTPGIKGFGMLNMEKNEVGHYFREIFHFGRECRYSDCQHIGEPGCAVTQAVNTGAIAMSRYESYLSVLSDMEEGKYR